MKWTILLTLLLCSSCAPILREKSQSPDQGTETYPELVQERADAELLLEESGKDIVYGSTIGEASVSFAAMLIFPPYGVYQLGRFAASAFGYDLSVSEALPDGPKEVVQDSYASLTSVPGRAISLINGEEFRERPMAFQKLRDKKIEESWEHTSSYLSLPQL